MNKKSTGKGTQEIDPLTREKVRARARTLASMDGRTPTEVSQADYEQAKRELTGKPELAEQEAILDLMPEATFADIAPGSTGRQIPELPCEDEDSEGRSEGERLVEKGVAAAEHEQILQAAREIKHSERSEK